MGFSKTGPIGGRSGSSGAPAGMDYEVVANAVDRLRAWIEREGYRGYDPYDALNSPLVRTLTLGMKPLRIAAIQGVKRCPVNLRPVLGIARGQNPKGLGLFLWGYGKMFAVTRGEAYLKKVEVLLELLRGLTSGNRSGNCWGYNFDWQSRAFFVPRFTPTVVNSSFIGHALLDAFALTGLEQARDLALPVGTFILRGLNRLDESGTLCFSYTPVDRYFVHNANMLGASLLIRLYWETGEEEMKQTALAALAYSMKHQRADGSWYYSEKKGAHWIDSFHTGFNLQCLRYFLTAGFGEEYRQAFLRGVRYYAANFFLPDGTPKYYHDRTYPIDIHCPAQAVAFFSGMGEEYAGLTDRVLRWMIENMQGSSGAFYFQKHRYYTNRIPYMRWGQAWAFHALTEYLFHHGR